MHLLMHTSGYPLGRERKHTGRGARFHIDALMMPRFEVSTSGSGINVVGNNSVVANVEKTSDGKEWYTATFNFAQTNPKSVLTLNGNNPLSVTNASTSWGSDSSGQASGTPESYQISVSRHVRRKDNGKRCPDRRQR